MKRNILTIISLFSTLFAFSQSAQVADRYFSEKKYVESGKAYERLLSHNPQNQLYNYRYARCLYEQAMYEQCVPYFKKSVSRYVLANFYIGESLFQTYCFEEAANYFDTYLSNIDSTNANWNAVKIRFKQAQVGQRLIKRTQDISIIDSMKVSKSSFLSVYRMSKEAGSLHADSCCVEFTNSRQNRKLLTQRDVQDEKLKFYVTEKLINGWTDTVPFFSNRNADVNYPFVLNDGVTLYFASESPDGMGGLDIYRTRFEPATESFLKVENIGFPFNSAANDYMLAVDENLHVGYFATDRGCEFDSVMVIQFAWSDSKQYLSTLKDDSLTRCRARLACVEIDSTAKQQFETAFASYLTSELKLLTPEDTNSHAEKEFHFAVSDEKIYTRYEDFSNADALEIFKVYEQSVVAHEADIKRLEQLRAQYMNSSADERQLLARTIQELEETVVKQQYMLKQKENQIRKLENN